MKMDWFWQHFGILDVCHPQIGVLLTDWNLTIWVYFCFFVIFESRGRIGSRGVPLIIDHLVVSHFEDFVFFCPSRWCIIVFAVVIATWSSNLYPIYLYIPSALHRVIWYLYRVIRVGCVNIDTGSVALFCDCDTPWSIGFLKYVLLLFCVSFLCFVSAVAWTSASARTSL